MSENGNILAERVLATETGKEWEPAVFFNVYR